MTMMWIDRMGRYADVKGKSSTMTLRRSLANLGIDSLESFIATMEPTTEEDRDDDDDGDDND